MQALVSVAPSFEGVAPSFEALIRHASHATFSRTREKGLRRPLTISVKPAYIPLALRPP